MQSNCLLASVTRQAEVVRHVMRIISGCWSSAM
jgi:hypothetical protein